MSGPAGEVPASTLRKALRAAVDASSLRRVADDVGMSANGLRNVIDDKVRSHPNTWRLLNEWFTASEAKRARVGPDAARAALNTLVAGLSTRRANVARRRILDALRSVYKEAGEPPPSWLEEMRGD